MRADSHRCTPGGWHILVWAVSLALALASDQAVGYSFYQSDGVKTVWPGGQSLRYLSPGSFPPDSETEAVVLEAMALWNVIPATDFQFFASQLDGDYPIDHFDGFSDTTAVGADELDPGVLGVTYLVNDGPAWFDMDVVFSDFPGGVGYTFEFNPSCEVLSHPTPSNGYSFLLIAVHEFGHALGLGHDPLGNESVGTAWSVATMNPRYPSGGTMGTAGIVELHTDDRNGLRYLYPHSGPSGPHVPDLALSAFASSGVVGKAVPVFFDPPIVYPGEELIARSVIENLGTTNEFFVQQGFYLSMDDTLSATDTALGLLSWDVAAGDSFQFDVAIDLPDDLKSGSYYLASVLDEPDEVEEVFEDNNDVVYCEPLTVGQLPPSIGILPQQVIACGSSYTGPAPTVTHPLNMGPLTWSLQNAPAGMTVNNRSGVVSWANPVASPFPYAITLKATNGAGTGTQTLFLGVQQSAPRMAPIAGQRTSCQPGYLGPLPQLNSPSCMAPVILWTLEAGPTGMTIDANTGRVYWTQPEPSETPYTVTIRAANTVGNGMVSWTLSVKPGDMNADGGVDQIDFAAMRDCLSGPGWFIESMCDCSDDDGDGDLDLRDVSRFLTRLGS